MPKDAGSFINYHIDSPKAVRGTLLNTLSRGRSQNCNFTWTTSLRLNPLHLPPIRPISEKNCCHPRSAYDDLIENNTRRIKILEEMAQMIYREWFVNFRFPGHGQVKMVDSDLGSIPERLEDKGSMQDSRTCQ